MNQPELLSNAAQVIGDNIVKRRCLKNWSQNDLSFHSKVGTSTIERVENGHNFNIYTLLLLAKALEVQPSVLFEGVELFTESQVLKSYDELLTRLHDIRIRK